MKLRETAIAARTIIQTSAARPVSCPLAEEFEILVREADLAAQCRERFTHSNARLRLKCTCQNLADFGLGAAPMLSCSQLQCAVYIVGNITYS